MVSTRCVLVLAGLVAVAAPLLAAEDVPQRQLLQPPPQAIASPITDRLALRSLFFMPGVTTAVRYDSSVAAPGTLLSGEDTLGFPDQLRQFNIDLLFRIHERHRLHAQFHKLTRSGDRVITQPISFGNDLYLVNDRVLSSMDLRQFDLGYSWSALRTEKLELGVGLALHLLQMEGVLEVPARFERTRLDGAGPFPTLTADATWRATRRFSLNLAGSYLGGSAQGVKGGYHSWHGDLQFRARPNLALGLGYTHTRYRIDSATTDFVGFFKLKYAGPEAFLRVSF